MTTLSLLAAPAAASGTAGMPLWLVCLLDFTAIFALSALVLFTPGRRAERARRLARLTEVNRYRVLGALRDDEGDDEPGARAGERPVVTRALALLDKLVRARGQRTKIITELERSGLRIRPEEWAGIQLCVMVVAAACLTFLSGTVLLVPVGAAVGWGLCRVYIGRRASRRSAAFDSQLPDALQLLAGSLRAGFALNQSIGGVVREGTEPVASEFARALAEVRLGSELEDALESIAERMRSTDMHMVVMAIRIAREVGGNLAEVMGSTIGTMRERVQLRGQVRVLTAEGRLSAWILSGLPFALAGYLLLFKPGYLTPMFTTFIGIVLLIGGIVLLSVGTFWLRRLVKIEV